MMRCPVNQEALPLSSSGHHVIRSSSADAIPYNPCMPLPILSSTHATPADLVRLYLKTELDWSRHVAEETTLDVGTAMTGPQFPGVYHANCLFDAALPDSLTAAQAVEMVNTHFEAQGTRCWEWIMNPSAAPGRTQRLRDAA